MFGVNIIGERLEVATRIGCPCGCLRYCAQEVAVRNYRSEQKDLRLADFKAALKSVPTNVEVVFSGFCEPFANKETIDMVEHACATGHVVRLFTTLYQVSSNEIERLSKLKLEEFCLHLPDGQNMNFPVSQEYMSNVFLALKKIRNASVMLMNDNFRSDNRENVVRGSATKRKSVGYCTNFDAPQFVLVPNGNLQLCCRDFGLWHTVGNLFNESYATIRNRYMARKKDYQLCSLCDANKSRREMFGIVVVTLLRKRVKFKIADPFVR